MDIVVAGGHPIGSTIAPRFLTPAFAEIWFSNRAELNIVQVLAVSYESHAQRLSIPVPFGIESAGYRLASDAHSEINAFTLDSFVI